MFSATLVSLDPNDVLVIKVSLQLNTHQMSSIRAEFAKLFPSNKVCMYSGDTDLSFIRIAIEERLADEIILKEELNK